MDRMFNRVLGRAGSAERTADAKQFVGRMGFAGRAGADEDFSGETGAERRLAHRERGTEEEAPNHR